MKKALLVIDVQNGMFLESNPVYNGHGLLKNIKKLIAAARLSDTPVYYIQHNASSGRLLDPVSKEWEIHPEIKPIMQDIVIEKRYPDAFLETSLEIKLMELGIEHVIITGIQTEICIDTTCRRASSMGYKVTLVSDTHSTWDRSQLEAQQIIDHHNEVLSWFADVYPSGKITF